MAWTVFFGSLVFGTMKYLRILRVPELMERSGIDYHEHGGSAINMRQTYSLHKSRHKNGNKYHHPMNNNNINRAVVVEEEMAAADGNFDNKVEEASLEKRLAAVADSDEDVM